MTYAWLDPAERPGQLLIFVDRVMDRLRRHDLSSLFQALSSLFGSLADLTPPRRKPERLMAANKLCCDWLRGGQAAHRTRDILQHRPMLDARGTVNYQAERNDELDHDGDILSTLAYAALQQNNAKLIPASRHRDHLFGFPMHKQVSSPDRNRGSLSGDHAVIAA